MRRLQRARGVRRRARCPGRELGERGAGGCQRVAHLGFVVADLPVDASQVGEKISSEISDRSKLCEVSSRDHWWGVIGRELGQRAAAALPHGRHQRRHAARHVGHRSPERLRRAWDQLCRRNNELELKTNTELTGEIHTLIAELHSPLDRGVRPVTYPRVLKPRPRRSGLISTSMRRPPDRPRSRASRRMVALTSAARQRTVSWSLPQAVRTTLFAAASTKEPRARMRPARP